MLRTITTALLISLAPALAHATAKADHHTPALPAAPDTAQPRYEWRGLHVDVSRHFFGPQVLRELMDRMAPLGLNRLHLHLTDGPGWRLEIKAYPRLTSVGAWRKVLTPEEKKEWANFEIGSHFPQLYGGFYTQEEMRELVRYGAQRGISIIPEIDLPGHSFAALTAYPQWLIPGKGLKESQCGRDILDVDNPEVQLFARRVLDELMSIFPKGTPIHLGGDEVDPAVLSKEKQRKFLQGLVDYLAQHGHPAITWDEAAENGVRGQIVMLWRSGKVEKILSLGLPTILCPNSHFYFDYPQSDSPDEPPAMGHHIISAQHIRDYQIPQNPNIIGLQGNVWTEHISTPQHLFYMIFPRAEALAEKTKEVKIEK